MESDEGEMDVEFHSAVKQFKNVFFHTPNRDLELNDEYLMKLILEHPIMFDPTRYFYVADDEYLQPYAWSFIAEKFNAKYNELGFDGLFMGQSLQMRWNELIELIDKVGIYPYILEIPLPMRDYVCELRRFIKKSEEPRHDIRSIRLNLTHNIEYIKQLPAENQSNLETFFVQEIVKYEQETLAIFVQSPENLQRIKDDVHGAFILMKGEV